MKPIRKTLILVLFLTLTLTSCADRGVVSSDVLLPHDLPDGFEGPTVSYNTGRSVTIDFWTGVPTMCNVAFGVDTTYGSLATMSMMEGAVRDHSIILTGLEPETTYHYRINLTDESATFYQSQDFTFTTAAVENVQAQAQSLALDVIDVSSNFGNGDNGARWGANSAVDGDLATEWSSNSDGDNAWIEVSMSGTYQVNEIGFWTRKMNNDTAQIFKFTVTTNQGETFGPFELPDADQIYRFPVEFTAKSLRFDAVETNTGNTGAVEIVVYGQKP